MKSEEKFRKMIKYCRVCERPTVHALSTSETFWSCGCGEIIRIDTVSPKPIRGQNFNYFGWADQD